MKNTQNREWLDKVYRFGESTSSEARNLFSGRVDAHIAPIIERIIQHYEFLTTKEVPIEPKLEHIIGHLMGTHSCQRKSKEVKVDQREKIIIADLGGANGSVAKRIIQAIPSEVNFQVDVVDRNTHKFKADSKYPNLKFYNCDLRDICAEDRCNVILMRYALHYNSPEEQNRIVANAKRLLRDGGLLRIIDLVAQDSVAQDRMNSIYKFISEITGTKRRCWLDESEFRKLVEGEEYRFESKVGLGPEYTFSANDFYRARYGLNRSQVKELKKVMEDKPLTAKEVIADIKFSPLPPYCDYPLDILDKHTHKYGTK